MIQSEALETVLWGGLRLLDPVYVKSGGGGDDGDGGGDNGGGGGDDSDEGDNSRDFNAVVVDMSCFTALQDDDTWKQLQCKCLDSVETEQGESVTGNLIPHPTFLLCAIEWEVEKSSILSLMSFLLIFSYLNTIFIFYVIVTSVTSFTIDGLGGHVGFDITC